MINRSDLEAFGYFDAKSEADADARMAAAANPRFSAAVNQWTAAPTLVLAAAAQIDDAASAPAAVAGAWPFPAGLREADAPPIRKARPRGA